MDEEYLIHVTTDGLSITRKKNTDKGNVVYERGFIKPYEWDYHLATGLIKIFEEITILRKEK